MATPKKPTPRRKSPTPPAQTPADGSEGAFNAARAEAAKDQAGELMNPDTPTSTVVTWRDSQFRVPSDMSDLDVEVQEAAEAGRMVAHLVLIMGEEQWENLKAEQRAAGTPVKVNDPDDIALTIGRQAYGATPGE